MLDDDTSRPEQRPGDRLEKLGRHPLKRKPEAGPPELTARHRLLIEYQIYGCPHRSACQRITRPKAVLDDAGQPVIADVPVEPGEPLSLEEAADLLGIRRRNARELTRTVIFQRAYAAELQAFREGEKIRSMHRVVAIRDDAGAGKAADKKVQLAAAGMILGEDAGPRAPSVVVNVGTQITAGIVVRLPASAQMTPLERTINHEDN